MAKRIKKAFVGQLVDVPVYVFAGHRYGDNGTLFRPGVVTKVYANTKGVNCIKVIYPSDNYRYDKTVIEYAFQLEAVREYIGVRCRQAMVNECPDRSVFPDGTYGNETEFLIDQGFVHTADTVKG